MAIGDFRHTVFFQKPGPAVPDGDGGYTQSWIDLVPPAWRVSIEPATSADLERVTVGHGDVARRRISCAGGFIRA